MNNNVVVQSTPKKDIFTPARLELASTTITKKINVLFLLLHCYCGRMVGWWVLINYFKLALVLLEEEKYKKYNSRLSFFFGLFRNL